MIATIIFHILYASKNAEILNAKGLEGTIRE